MTITTNLMELRKLAEAATPSPHHIYTHPRDDNHWEANEAWHKAAGPTEVIELLDTLEAQAKQIEALQANSERYLWWVKTMTSKNAMDIISDAFKHLPHDVVPTVEQFAEVVDAARKGNL